MHRRPIRDLHMQEMHIDAGDYLATLNIMLKYSEVPDSIRIAEWQTHRTELESCIGGHRTLLADVPESAKKHTELIKLVDGILDRLPALPGVSETSQLGNMIHDLSACRKRVIWY